MRILFISGRELSYERNTVLLRALGRFADVDVIGHPARPRSLLAGTPSLILRGLLRLAGSALYDLLLVGFYGYPLAQVLARVTRTPLLFDAFVSNYDTLCFDRQICTPGSWRGRLAHWLDRSTCKLADGVLLDTPQHADYFVKTFALPPGKVYSLPVGCNEDLFHPRPQPTEARPLMALTYSSYMPLHGMDVVVQAAALLRDLPLHFQLIGAGPELARVQALAASLGLGNVTFRPPVAKEALVQEIAAAHICLGGHFGVSGKAGRVVPGKLYQMLAMARPVIAGATPANRAFLDAGRDALLVPPGDPASLADAVEALAGDARLRARLARAGRAAYEAQASESVITERLRGIVETVLDLESA